MDEKSLSQEIAQILRVNKVKMIQKSKGQKEFEKFGPFFPPECLELDIDELSHGIDYDFEQFEIEYIKKEFVVDLEDKDDYQRYVGFFKNLFIFRIVIKDDEDDKLIIKTRDGYINRSFGSFERKREKNQNFHFWEEYDGKLIKRSIADILRGKYRNKRGASLFSIDRVTYIPHNPYEEIINKEGDFNTFMDYAYAGLDRQNTSNENVKIDIFTKFMQIGCANGNWDDYVRIKDWIAHSFQYPRERLPMIVLIGDEGTPKNILFEYICQLLGKSNSIIVNTIDDLVGKKILENKMFCYIKELKPAISSERDVRKNSERLKNLIDEYKYVHFAGTSRSIDCIHLDPKDKSFAIFQMFTQKDVKHFEKLDKFIKEDSRRQIVMNDLLTWDVRNFNIKNLLETNARRCLLENSVDPLLTILLKVLSQLASYAYCDEDRLIFIVEKSDLLETREFKNLPHYQRNLLVRSFDKHMNILGIEKKQLGHFRESFFLIPKTVIFNNHEISPLFPEKYKAPETAGGVIYYITSKGNNIRKDTFTKATMEYLDRKRDEMMKSRRNKVPNGVFTDDPESNIDVRTDSDEESIESDDSEDED